MQYEWDESKRRINLVKHKIDFADAYLIHEAEGRMTQETTKLEHGERRWIDVSPVAGRLLMMAYTLRGEIVRVISMRKANKRERKMFNE